MAFFFYVGSNLLALFVDLFAFRVYSSLHAIYLSALMISLKHIIYSTLTLKNNMRSFSSLNYLVCHHEQVTLPLRAQSRWLHKHTGYVRCLMCYIRRTGLTQQATALDPVLFLLLAIWLTALICKYYFLWSVWPGHKSVNKWNNSKHMGSVTQEFLWFGPIMCTCEIGPWQLDIPFSLKFISITKL